MSLRCSRFAFCRFVEGRKRDFCSFFFNFNAYEERPVDTSVLSRAFDLL